ncbi:MAG: bifunctional phosphopantothenoylcysteine decarboxylase/phosphopantothenate--cysteine ligase CoaBC [Candidatus Auribacterota bacterium]|nr:bifunctional phosphopantothenoylcysteine decarboxylase/phosphopantothenate--cysteine ligase CoaBC [Candidatus Auribacterota bacterium]
MRFIITTGPTREFIDPFRFISNPSSGKMGYALARAVVEQGGDVILISGPVTQPPVSGVVLISVISALEMREEVNKHISSADVVIMAAAISDYRPAHFSKSKIKKSASEISIPLTKNPDILKELGEDKGDRILVGFSAETDNIVDNAIKKLKSKNLDLIIANDISASGSGFHSETNQVILIDSRERVEEWPLMSKTELAQRIIQQIIDNYLPSRGER